MPIQEPDPAYTLEQAQSDVAGLRTQQAYVQDIISTVSDKALLLYAPDQHAIPRGPTSWSFEDGTVSGWGAINGAVTNSAVTATGWPTDGSKSLLLTANGGGQPRTTSDAGNPVPSQPGDLVYGTIDIYCPVGLNHVFAGILWLDDTGTLISEVDGPDTVFSAGQVQTLYFSGTAPDLTASFRVRFGDHNTDPNATLIYGDNIQVAGNLHISASPGGGTDSVGNPYDSGYEIQGAGAFRARGVSGQSISMDVSNAGVPEVLFGTGASYQSAPGILSMGQAAIGGVKYMFVTLSSPNVSGNLEDVGIALNSAPASGSSFDAGGDLLYTDSSGVLNDVLTWGSSGVRVKGMNPSDANTYQVERVTTGMVSGSPITVNQTGFSQQIMGSLHVGVGLYIVHGQVLVHPNQAAGFIELEFGGGATSASMNVYFEETAVTAPGGGSAALVFGNGAIVNAFAQAFSGSTFGTADRCVKFRGEINVNAAGGFALFAACGTSAADTYQVKGIGCYMELNPIGP